VNIVQKGWLPSTWRVGDGLDMEHQKIPYGWKLRVAKPKSCRSDSGSVGRVASSRRLHYRVVQVVANVGNLAEREGLAMPSKLP